MCQHQKGQILLEQSEKPGLRNFETKLIIQRLGRCCEQALRLREQADEPAVINGPGDPAFHARPVNFQQQRDQHFRRHQTEQHAQCAREPEINFRESRFDSGNAERGEKTDIGARQKETRAGAQQPVVFQPRDGHGKSSQQKQQQRENPEQRQRRQRPVGHHAVGGFGNPAPEQPRAARFEQKQQHAEARHKKFLELLACPLRRKNLRVLRFKQCRFAFGAGEFLHFQFFQPLIFFEPHLEPAGEGHQHTEAEENRARLTRQRIDEAGHNKCGDENRHPRHEIHQTVFLYVAFHSLTQFPFLKQRRADGQRRARVSDQVGKGLADVAPVERAFAHVQSVREPEKLPVWNDGVKR